jgi:hypothetical protein
VLEIESRGSLMLSTTSTTELHPYQVLDSVGDPEIRPRYYDVSLLTRERLKYTNERTNSLSKWAILLLIKNYGNICQETKNLLFTYL